MPPRQFFKTFGKFLPVIGVALLLYMIIDIGGEKIVYAFITIPFYYYVFALLVFLPRLFLYAYKWQYLSRKQQMDFDLIYLAKVFLISLFYGSVTPGSLGWYTRIYYLKAKSNASLEKCITNSLLDGTLALLSGLALAIFSSFFLGKYMSSGILTVLIIVFIFYSTAFIILMKRNRGGKLFNLIIRPLIPDKFKTSVDKSIDSLYKDIPRLRDTVLPLIIEGASLTLATIQVYIIALSFSINVPLLTFISISIISAVVAGVLPISIGGLGIREGTFVLLLSKFGVNPEIAFVISLSGFMVKILIPGLIGLIISFGGGKRVIKPTTPF